MSSVKEVKESEFGKEVLKSDKPVLVDFHTTWCGPCKVFAPVLEGVANAYEGRLKVVKVDVDGAQDVAARYGIQAVPTLVLFKDGTAVETMVGVPAGSVLRAKLDAAVEEPAEARGGGCCCCG